MNSNPPSYTFLDADKTKEMLQLWKAEKIGWVQVGEKKWVLSSRYVEDATNYYNFKARSSDTWVMSFPRSGTHWTMEMVWLLSNNLDFNAAKVQRLEDRFSALSLLRITDFEVLNALESPRFIYSHFPLSLFPNVIESGCKIVYVARNPKDVAVSWYFLHKAFGGLKFISDFPTFWNYFKNDLIIWSPYWEHLKEAWAQKNNPNFLFIFYEEMKADLFSVVKKVSTFLGKEYSDDEFAKLVDDLDFKNFLNNPMRDVKVKEEGGQFLTSGCFIREGKSGNWKSTFTEELEKEADEWIAENMKDTDLVFPMEKIIF